MSESTPPASGDHRSGAAPVLSDYLGVLRRRYLVILAALVMTPIVVVIVSLAQTSKYQASSDVLIGGANYAALVNGLTPPANDGERTASTLASLARVPEVARRVLAAAKFQDRRTPEEFLNQSSVASTTGADILRFTVTDPNRAIAERLATTYAEVFTKFRRDLDNRAISEASAGIDAELAKLGARGARGTPAYKDLVAKRQQLTTLAALQTNSAVVVQPAVEATKTGPQPARNVILGLGLGVILAIGLAYLAESLDTRVRSVDDLERWLGASVLGRVPLPRSRAEVLPMIALPNGRDAEAFRMLRTSFDFVNLNHNAHSVLVTSSIGDEGKSVVSANLAGALARAQRRVILCDLDARKPSIADMFGLGGLPGIADVVLRRTDLEEALVPVSLSPGEAGNGVGASESLLRVLTLGSARPPAPGEFVGSPQVQAVIKRLEEMADFVIIDGPPLLVVSDALTVAQHVDAMIVVARTDRISRSVARETRRVLSRTSTPLLGLVTTGPRQAMGTPNYLYDISTDGAATKPVAETSPFN